MSELEVWKGLDFSSYQMGDVIIISEKDMNKLFRWGHKSWGWFQAKLLDISKKIKLNLYIEYDASMQEYLIYMLDFEPPSSYVARPDAAVSGARRMVWARHHTVSADGTVGGFTDEEARDFSNRGAET